MLLLRVIIAIGGTRHTVRQRDDPGHVYSEDGGLTIPVFPEDKPNTEPSEAPSPPHPGSHHHPSLLSHEDAQRNPYHTDRRSDRPES